MSRATRISFGKGRACTIQRQAAAIVRADAFEVTVRHGKNTLSGAVTHADKGSDVIFILSNCGD